MTPINPARLSPLVGDLFPATVVAAQMCEPGDAALLLPGEREAIAHAVPKRIQEFTAGRLCARRALAEFGIRDFALRMGADRQPVWPEGFAGSITHTDAWCVAVVADQTAFMGVGVDSEVVGRVGPRVLPRICTTAESEWLKGLAPAEHDRALTLVFAAKEAFYKAQYPSTRERLSFRDVAIEASDWGGSRGAFLVRPLRCIALEPLVSGGFPGRYEFHDEFVSAGVGLPASGRAPDARHDQ